MCQGSMISEKPRLGGAGLFLGVKRGWEAGASKDRSENVPKGSKEKPAGGEPAGLL